MPLLYTFSRFCQYKRENYHYLQLFHGFENINKSIYKMSYILRHQPLGYLPREVP